MYEVYVGKVSDEGIKTSDVVHALEWLKWENFTPPGAKVFIKPNLTWPVHIPGVTTTPLAIEAVVAALKMRTDNIIVGESDGGYHSYDAEEAFAGHNLYELQEKYGIQVVNLSDIPAEAVSVPVAGRNVSITLPRLLLRDTDVFVTMPVPKTHVMTKVSLAFKNQWGCLPSPMRLKEHPDFDFKIIAINRLLNPKLAIFDGTYFLNGAGPMTGEAVRMNLLIAGDDPGGSSAVACAVMGMNPRGIRHLRLAMQEKMFPASLREVNLSSPLEQFIGNPFHMRRAFLDWISLLGFRSRLFTNLFWLSTFSGPLHMLLHIVRRNPLIEKFLYGQAGSPPEWKRS